ncbi:murein DD-endopeptidase MepM [Spirabiliibacterium falconis]|uniref:murein DD-endopeptidase MepM n=1 Tax=Spirabiliibacterium falconis TaxID=572023 RepID=UPI001AAD6DB8|nr:murein DD-endopeptidase MepM [Spirabiliibacterium falconis]MBE2893906.1 murein DD-endopeptidase MepM [Spirabiliibacterium falconis]
MKNVILARDRKRRQRNRKIAFVALFVLLWAVALYFLYPSLFPHNESAVNPHQPTEYVATDDLVPKTVQNHPENVQSQSEESSPADALAQHNEESAVSEQAQTAGQAQEAEDLDDGLSEDKDDEVEPGSQTSTEDTDFLPEEAQNAIDTLIDAADQAWRINNQFSETVVGGETLQDILEQSGQSPDVANALIKQYPELKKLKAGQQFYWILDKNDQVDYINWLVSDRQEQIFQRQSDGTFKRQILEKKSVWKTEVIKGEISGSFSSSLNRKGLSLRQIKLLSNALQWQVKMRELHKGDKFAILMTREYLGDKLTGQGKVDAIHVLHNGKSYYAIQAANGAYFNVNGETLGRGFARYPLTRQPRISSPFNPYRRHPITKRVSPHKGVDFSVPIGTPIIAPADGQVVKVAYQARGAGRYLVLQHGRNYKTVYMHLSRTLVKPGQQIKRGQRIALSGNTGRSTGPHLHYEFHINDRPVNPMTVKLPGNNAGLPAKERKAFLAKAKKVVQQLKL